MSVSFPALRGQHSQPPQASSAAAGSDGTSHADAPAPAANVAPPSADGADPARAKLLFAALLGRIDSLGEDPSDRTGRDTGAGQEADPTAHPVEAPEQGPAPDFSALVASQDAGAGTAPREPVPAADTSPGLDAARTIMAAFGLTDAGGPTAGADPASPAPAPQTDGPSSPTSRSSASLQAVRKALEAYAANSMALSAG